MKDKTKGDVGMKNIDMVTRLGFIIEQATRAEDYKLANELSLIQLDLIEERSRAWNEGFDTGFSLKKRQQELKKFTGAVTN